MRRLGVLTAVAFAALLACGGAPLARPDAEASDVPARCAPWLDLPGVPAWSPEEVIKGNLGAVQAEDLDCATAGFHVASPQREPTRAMSGPIFAAYDLAYHFERVEPARIEGDTAWVGFVQVTSSVRPDPSFRSNRITGTHELRREGARWRLWTTVISDIAYL